MAEMEKMVEKAFRDFQFLLSCSAFLQRVKTACEKDFQFFLSCCRRTR